MLFTAGDYLHFVIVESRYAFYMYVRRCPPQKLLPITGHVRLLCQDVKQPPRTFSWIKPATRTVLDNNNDNENNNDNDNANTEITGARTTKTEKA